MLGNSASTLPAMKPPVGVQQPSLLDAWRVDPTGGGRYEVLDGLRGLAILLVVVCHVPYVNVERGAIFQFLEQLIDTGRYGVPVFFALSGFLVSHPLWKRKLNGDTTGFTKAYIWCRFVKIYPPFLLSICLLTPIYIARTGDAGYVSLAREWLLGRPLLYPVSLDLNSVMWSLIVEVHFYFVLPLVFVATRRISPRGSLWLVAFALIAVPTAFRIWHLCHGRAFALDPEINVYFPSLLDGFAFGVLVAGLESMQRIHRAWGRLGDIGALLLFGMMPVTAWFSLHPVADRLWQLEVFSWFVKLAAGFLLFYIADPRLRGARLLQMKWLCWCGLISYEWYLFHQPVILWIRETFGSANGSIPKYAAIVGGATVIGILIAALAYRFVSLPILRWARGRLFLRGQAPLHHRAVSL